MPDSFAKDRGSSPTYAIAGAEQVDSLPELWLTLHQHHRATANLQPMVEDGDSWPRRRRFYLERLNAGSAFLALARADTKVVGYAMVLIEEGPDDTWPLGDLYAELYSLSVLPEHRNAGIGTGLLDFIDEELRRREISDVRVAVMVGNENAQRLYGRRGFVPAEVVLYRLGRIRA